MARLIGQEPAPSKCVLLSTSKVIRDKMRSLILSDEGDKLAVKLDMRDLGGHLDTTRRGWSSTLAARVRLVISRLVLMFVLPLDFHGRVSSSSDYVHPLCPALGVEASYLSKSSFLKLRAAVCCACGLVPEAAIG